MNDPSLAAPPSAAPVRASSGGARAIAWFALLGSACALGASFWLWQQLSAAQAGTRDLAAELARRDAGQHPDRSADLLRRADAGEAAIAALQAQTQAQEKAQAGMQTALARLVAERPRDTQLAEAEYLQRLAAQSLLMGREVRGAIALLEASDEILRARDDPALHEARALLAGELEALRAVAGFDLEGTYLRLAALAAAVPTLELPAHSLSESQASPGQAAPSGWLARVWALLERFVVIRRDAAPLSVLPSPAEEQALRTGIRLSLEQAKLALLAAGQQAYASALADAQTVVRTRFAGDAAANRAFLEELARLAALRIAPELPDLSGSLRALRAASRTDAGPG